MTELVVDVDARFNFGADNDKSKEIKNDNDNASNEKTKGGRKRSGDIEFKLDILIDKVRDLASAIAKSHNRNIFGKLYDAVMKCEGYDESQLVGAFEYLLGNDISDGQTKYSVERERERRTRNFIFVSLTPALDLGHTRRLIQILSPFVRLRPALVFVLFVSSLLPTQTHRQTPLSLSLSLSIRKKQIHFISTHPPLFFFREETNKTRVFIFKYLLMGPLELQMEPLEKIPDLINEGEIHLNSSSPAANATRKVYASGTERSHFNSLAEVTKSCDLKWVRSRMLMSSYLVLIKAKINVLLPFGPLAIILHYLTGKHGWVFFFSLLGIIPLAERLGYATEQLAFYTGPTVGGLLNATFGNATEMIISIYALKNGMIRVVQQSLLGSILSNMLLVLGCAFFTGGIVHYKKDQVFNKAAAVVNSGLLLMAVMGLMFPAVLHFTRSEIQYGKSELALSRFSSCVMLVAYASYLVFQLKSRHNAYSPIDEEEGQIEEDSDEEAASEITYWEAICWLSILTAWVSVLSGYLVDAIQGASESMSMSVAFISVILLPIVGNAAEHASAIMFAMKDKLDITLGVAIGSSTQISMFVIPFCVVIGWIFGKPMDLNFQLFETATLFITVLVVAFMLQEGTANYFKGLMLILCYLIVAASFFVHIDPTTSND